MSMDTEEIKKTLRDAAESKKGVLVEYIEHYAAGIYDITLRPGAVYTDSPIHTILGWEYDIVAKRLKPVSIEFRKIHSVTLLNC
ncbi:MAG: hypothetical protein PHE24_00125 [Patescibacteria group bacterium]|nr:hypothetical protein [Patescibacteria group bacterium]